MNKIAAYIVASLVSLIAIIPPVGLGLPNPNMMVWTALVTISGFVGLILLLTKVNLFVKAAAILGLINCFFSAAPFIAFNTYIQLVAACYFYLLCTKVEDWTIVFKTLAIVFMFECLLMILQFIKQDPLLNFSYGGGSVFGTVGNSMMTGTFLTVITAALVTVSPLFFIPIILIFQFVHSHWMIVSTAAGSIVYFYLENKVLAGVVALVLIIFAFNNIGEAKSNLVDSNNRLNVWRQTLKLANQHPIAGWGIGTYQYIFPGLSKNFIPGEPYASAHNDWLQTIFETGYPGFAFIASIFIYLSIRLRKAKKNAMFAGLVMIAVIMCAHFPLRMMQCVPMILAFLAYCEHKTERV